MEHGGKGAAHCGPPKCELCRVIYNAYMRDYMKERYYRRLAAVIRQLGGRCFYPGCSRSDNLEIDHIDPQQKSFTVTNGLGGWSDIRIQKELKKCQLLCPDHHKTKSITERGHTIGKGRHGTEASARYCKPRCDLCKAAVRTAVRHRKDTARK